VWPWADGAGRHGSRWSDPEISVHDGVVRMPGKIVSFGCLLSGGAAAGYVYLVRVLRPVPPGTACIMLAGQLHHWRCVSYEFIVSTPFFVTAGALIGTWLAYALVRLYSAPGRRSVALGEGLVVAPPVLGITAWIIAVHPGMSWNWDSLGWDGVLVFLLAAVLVRLAIGVASIAEVRGGLLLALGMPVICSGLGYSFIKIFQLPPVGHSCPIPGPACFFHPLIGESGPWIILGLLAGLWLAYAAAAGLARSPRRGLIWIECAIALPAMTAVIWWALVIGPDQAGGGYVPLFVLAVGLAALLRLLLAAPTVKKKMPGMLTTLGMIEGPRHLPGSRGRFTITM
jgi:hypothetical protein